MRKGKVLFFSQPEPAQGFSSVVQCSARSHLKGRSQAASSTGERKKREGKGEGERTKGEEGEEAAGTLKNGLKAGGKGAEAHREGGLPGGQKEQSSWLEDLGGGWGHTAGK